MYHAVTPVLGKYRSLGLDAGALGEQLGTLTESGLKLVSLNEALAASPIDQQQMVALTFDDAYQDFLTGAVDVLRSVGARATIFVPTAYIGQHPTWLGRSAGSVPNCMSWRELEECLDTGIVDVGSHGVSHTALDVLHPARLLHELRDSRDALEQQLGISVNGFCYPHGYNSPRVRCAVQESGYDHACQVGRRLTPITDRFNLSRLAVPPTCSGPSLLRLVERGGPRIVPAAKRAATPMWRAVRLTSSRLSVA